MHNPWFWIYCIFFAFTRISLWVWAYHDTCRKDLR